MTAITESWPTSVHRATADPQRAGEWALKLIMAKVEFQVQVIGSYYEFSYNGAGRTKDFLS